MDQDEFVEKFINQRIIEANRNSCLVMALQDARLLNGRDKKTGKFKNIILRDKDYFYNPNSFTGLVIYLILLDMIGHIFLKKGFKTKHTNKIHKTLEQFSNLDDKEIAVVISLRNSLAHNYSLVNIPYLEKKNYKELHKFELIYVDTPFIISIPSELNKWKRKDFKDKRDESSTKIGVKKLIDEFENVYSNLNNEFKQGNVTLDSIGLEELKSRFTIRY